MAAGSAWETHGSGPPVVLIHGLGLNRSLWQWQLDALSPHFTLVCYDLLGHGQNIKTPGPYRMEMMVEQLASLLVELDIRQTAIVGFSLGGLIAQAFAIAHPQMTQSLVILNSAYARSEEQRQGILLRVRQASEDGPAATVDDALKRWFSKSFAASQPEVLALVKEWVCANDRDTYPALYRLLADGDIGLEEAIAEIHCPALVITGEEDYGNSPEMAVAMAAKMPNASVVVLPRLRHMALAEDPATVNSLLLPFLLEHAA